MFIQVTSKEKCPMCNATDRFNKKNKIDQRPEYSKRMLEDMPDQEAFRQELRDKNFSSFPIVETDTPVGSWCGYNPDKLKALKEYLASVDTDEVGTYLASVGAEQAQVA